jgi:IS605 OrfB family transposase
VITIKLKHKLLTNNNHIFIKYLKEFNHCFRTSYNLIYKKQITNLTQLIQNTKTNIKNIQIIDASLVAAATQKALQLKDKKKVIFGGKNNFFLRKFNKITKQEYKDKRNIPIYFRGSSNDNLGNRKFLLDITNNRIIFKPSKHDHFIYEIFTSKIQKKQLLILEEKCKKKESCFTCSVDNEFIYISFDEKILKEEQDYLPIKNRILSIDLNPNYPVFVIKDFSTNKIIKKHIFDLTELNKKEVSSDKRNYETFQVSKQIISFSKHYKVDYIAFEDLNIKSKNLNKGKKLNRLINNYWNRKKFIQNLIKHCNINGIKFHAVPAQYSSFIGQLDNPNDFDSISAAIEIGRRCFEFVQVYVDKVKKEEKGNIIFPKVNVSNLTTQWKKMLDEITDKTYYGLYCLWKRNLKFSYRFLFNLESLVVLGGSSFRLNSDKSLVNCHIY